MPQGPASPRFEGWGVPRLIVIALTLILAGLSAGSAATAQTTPYRKLALVIGNTEYDGNVLDNPERDADAVYDRLKALGFTVTKAKNLGRQQLGSAIAQFEDQVADNDFVLIFYAGHGVEAAGQTYLIPVDAKLQSPSSPRLEGVRVEDLWSFARKPFGTVILFDACRSSPFLGRVKGDVAGAHAISTPENTLLLFSSSAGRPASDGAGSGHSAFTSALLESLAKPDTRLDEVIRSIKRAVSAATGESQVPQRYGQLDQEFAFSGFAPVYAPMAAQAPPSAERPATSPAPPASAPVKLAEAAPVSDPNAEPPPPPGLLRSAKPAGETPPHPAAAAPIPPPPIVAAAAPGPSSVGARGEIIPPKPTFRTLALEKIEELVVPKSFCSLEEKYAFINTRQKPANEAAVRNNAAAIAYKLELAGLFVHYRDATVGTLYTADIRQEIARITPVADAAFATAQALMHMFDTLMAVPVAGPCKK